MKSSSSANEPRRKVLLTAAATGLALAETAGLVAAGAAARYSVQIPDGGRSLDAATAAVRTAPGVTKAEAVSESEMRKTLERWLGPAATSAELPVPALINFDVANGANLNAIQQRARGVEVAAHAQVEVGLALRAHRRGEMEDEVGAGGRQFAARKESKQVPLHAAHARIGGQVGRCGTEVGQHDLLDATRRCAAQGQGARGQQRTGESGAEEAGATGDQDVHAPSIARRGAAGIS